MDNDILYMETSYDSPNVWKKLDVVTNNKSSVSGLYTKPCITSTLDDNGFYVPIIGWTRYNGTSWNIQTLTQKTSAYSITVEAYCEPEAASKIITFSINGIDYESPFTRVNFQSSYNLTAPRTDGNPLHVFKEWKKDGLFFSKEQSVEITGSGTYQIVFEEKTSSVSCTPETVPFSNYLDIEFVVWVTQDYLNAEIAFDILDELVFLTSHTKVVDLSLGENIIIVEFDTLSLSTSYRLGDSLAIEVDVVDQTQQSILSGTYTISLDPCTKLAIFTRLNRIAFEWSQSSPIEKGEIFVNYLNPLAYLWGLCE